MTGTGEPWRFFGADMRKVILYIAMSLDGYIADAGGGVGWLSGQDGAETEGSYDAFVKTVDTVVMGWRTYRQIVTELSPGEWVYGGMRAYVVTHRALPPTDDAVFFGGSPCELIEELRAGEGKDIWICGGADLAGQLLEADLIDRFHISVIPTLLGSGIRLFQEGIAERKLRLVRTAAYDGIVDLVYERR